MTATVIFDLDGTLVNTEALYLKSNVKAAAVLGLHRTEADFRPLVGSAGPSEAKIIADLVGADHAAWFQQFSTQDVLDRFAAVPILSYPELTKRCRCLIGWVID